MCRGVQYNAKRFIQLALLLVGLYQVYITNCTQAMVYIEHKKVIFEQLTKFKYFEYKHDHF